MAMPILSTKLHIPPLRPGVVPRPRLIERLNAGREGKLILVSAAAGFGKSTLVSAWVAGLTPPAPPAETGPGARVAWLSLDAGDSDPVRFLAYLAAAVQSSLAGVGAEVTAALESPQPPPTEAILTALLNELATLGQEFVLVLDDYHLIDARPGNASGSVDDALTFLLEHQPPQMHLVIATREDPALPLARLRARGQMTEVRAADLRFTPSEAAEFLNRVMGLNLSAADIAALETRTEGWIAGLQLAALSLQGHPDTAGFVQSFTGSHRFVLDYLMEEVLAQQSTSVQAFLMRTSILDRLCGALCDAVLLNQSASGQATLDSLERANLFVVPLDNERRWRRYHHLFGDLLRQRLGQSLAPEGIAELHSRASEWFKNNDLILEAFHHAAAANDRERAERLIKGGRIPQHSRAAVTTVLDWLDFLPTAVLDANPWLWVRSAMAALNAGQTIGVEEKLQAAENALQKGACDDESRDLTGQIAAVSATLALARYRPDTILIQAHRALEHLHPDNLPFRSRALRALGFAHQLKGERAAARRCYTEAIALPQTSGDIHLTVSAITGLGNVQEADNQLFQAAESYRHALQLLSDQQPPNADQEHIGLARICYEWNELDAAEQHAQQSLELARQYDRTVDRHLLCEVLLARLKLARGDAAVAADMLRQAELSARQQGFAQRLPEIAAEQARVLLRQGRVSAAAQLASQYDLPLMQARVFIAQNDPSAALSILEPCRQQSEARGWADERLKALILEALALHGQGETERAMHLLAEALALAEPGGFIRLFVDEGPPMARLLSAAAARRIRPGYVGRLLAAFGELTDGENPTLKLTPFAVRDGALSWVEPLSSRELEILKLIALGLSNREIGARLFLALDTVKGHNRRLFDKLQVQRRTEAIARARELGLL
jgi:LuxR family maltose regulon positive regulatory protein